MLELFDSIKQELHDAPTEVKSAFNKVVKYIQK